MAVLLTRLFLAAVLLVGAADSQGGYEGEDCVYAPTGQRGTCVLLPKCQRVLQGLLFRGIHPQICSYVGTVSVVCCPPAGEPAPAPPRPTNAPTPATPSALPADRPPLPSGQCPPLTKKAVTVQTTGQKAWDKCIELADYVYPCVSVGFRVNGPKERRDTCKRVSTPLIVGGSPTAKGEFPHMASLGYGDQSNIQWICGGTLISEKWVMTAGHCTWSRETDDVKYVRLGGDNTDSPIDRENFYTVINITSHPDYEYPIKYNDIALLQLDRTVVFTDYIRPACLHTGQSVDEGKAIATGWGAIRARGGLSNSLLKVTLQKFSHAECVQKNPAQLKKLKDGIRDDTQFCYGHRTEQKDTCQGDSGGPLQLFNDDNVFCTYLVIGVTSYGRDCAIRGQPGIYTRVAAFVPWIESVVWP